MKREPVLIANRGEIAIRIARTCKMLGFPTVGVYSEADRNSDHLRFCDQAYLLGPAEPAQSYLNVPKLMEVAKKSGARYVHPGYGFLSERPHFVEACQKNGLILVGPTAEQMRQMGDKIQARSTVDSLGIPRVPGSAGAVSSAQEALTIAKKAGFPVLLKAAAGGGGKGMRRVDSESDLSAAFDGATRESQNAFGDGSLYVEKFILEPHHVEIQVFGDGKGGAVHLGERECSIQRRHQKIWEETPSPILNQFPKTREAMFEAALKITQHIRYAGAGTLEFIVDGKGNFYFLEMNTRLQVEHPVTEWVTGVDLVAWQLLLACGEFQLPKIPVREGASIEVRVYAEDPKTFLPSPGPIGLILPPAGPFVRWDSSMAGTSGEISIHYDPMISKLSVWASSREEALNRIRVALDETVVDPPVSLTSSERQGSLQTNLGFLRRLVRNQQVIQGDTPTDLIPRNPDLTQDSVNEISVEAAIATSLQTLLSESSGSQKGDALQGNASSLWSDQARRESLRGP